MTPAAWTDWRPYAGWSPSADVLAETLDGGQSFGWTSVSVPTSGADVEIGAHLVWTGRWLGHVAQLRLHGGRLEWRALPGTTAVDLRHYLGEAPDWTVLRDTLPWRSDAHLATCLAAFPGLRILRQPFGETLLGFLCSATKQIVQIKQMIALLAERHGTALLPTPIPITNHPSPSFHRLPSWPELALIPEAELRACQFGFRARFISQTAHF